MTYIWFGVCPKCGEESPRVHYISSPYANPSPCIPTSDQHNSEHFHVHCDRCGYSWVADMQGRVR